MLIGRLSTLVLVLMLVFLPAAIAQTASKRTPAPSVKPSNILSEVSKRAKQEPSLSPVELAAYGNSLIAKKGFDYDFDVCDLLTQHGRTQNSTVEFVRSYQMTSSVGERLSFRFRVLNPGESLCGECWTSIPALQVTDKEMVLIADDRQYRVKRPSSFELDEVQLVDETLKKVSRTWQVPYQAIPIGISADGTKLYLDFYTEYELEELVLELTENGPPQFRDRGAIVSSEGQSIENHPTDPSNAYLSFMSFRVGEKIYRIKFTAPCT